MDHRKRKIQAFCTDEVTITHHDARMSFVKRRNKECYFLLDLSDCPSAPLSLSLLLELSDGYLNHVGTVLSLAPSPAYRSSVLVKRTGAFSRMGARDRSAKTAFDYVRTSSQQ
jgi:hypothetical protein